MYVDVKPVELVGTDKITKKQRYPRIVSSGRIVSW